MEQILGALVSMGLPGLFIAYLIWKNNKLEIDIDAKNKRIDELQEKRVTEAIVATNAANALAASNEKTADWMEKIDQTLRQVR